MHALITTRQFYKLTISCFAGFYQSIINNINHLGEGLQELFLRLILAWEFGQAGFEKLHGSNWFADITFPLPFNLLPPDLSWVWPLTLR